MSNYVLVTGASAGIGVEFATQLAREGYGLILTARRTNRLDELAEKLIADWSVPVVSITADLASPEGPQTITGAIEEKGLNLVGLVNNAGFGEGGLFRDISRERQTSMIQVNITSLVELTHALIPSLEGKEGAFIINVASTAAFQAGPTLAVYSATKAFVLSFSEALHEELKEKKIAVSALCPGATESEFSDVANMDNVRLLKMGAMTAKDVVAISLTGRKKAIVVPGVSNIMGSVMGKVAPRSITRKLSHWLMEPQRSI